MKRILSVIIILIMCISFVGCGKVTLDPSEVAAALKNGVQYDDELFQLSDDQFSVLYELPDSVKGAAYCGSGATAEEVAVFDAGDENSAKALLSEMQDRLKSRSASYASYMPDEVSKIDSAVLKQAGQYIILCVSPDNAAAEKIISGFLK